MKTITSQTTLAEIRDMLCEDGYEHLINRAKEIKSAARHGSLMWTREKLYTTDASRISAVSQCPIEPDMQ